MGKIKKRNDKYSLFNLLTITAGSMVGIGIFFKNQGVLAEAGTAWGAILAWVVGIVAVLTLAISFFEIASSTQKSGETGIPANWASKFVSPGAGRIINIFWNYIWAPVLVITISFFTVYFSQMAIGVDYNNHQLSHLIYVGGTAVVLGSIYLANAFNNKVGKGIQAFTFIIKFIPLFLVVILGFTSPAVEAADNAFGKGGASSVLTIILAVPGTLFALDAFLGGVALSKEEKNKGDAIKSTMLSVVMVGAFYLLFAIAVFLGTSDGDIFTLINNFAGSNSEVVTKLVFAAITISAYGVINGITISSARSVEFAHQNGFEFKKELITKKSESGAPVGALSYFMIIAATWFVLLFFSGYAMGATLDEAGNVAAQGYEVFIDQFSNVAVVGGFFVYALIVLGGLINRKTNQVKVDKVKGFVPIAIFAVMVNLSIVIIVFDQHLFSSDGIVRYFIVASLIIVGLLNFANNKILNGPIKKRK